MIVQGFKVVVLTDKLPDVDFAAVIKQGKSRSADGMLKSYGQSGLCESVDFELWKEGERNAGKKFGARRQ